MRPTSRWRTLAVLAAAALALAATEPAPPAAAAEPRPGGILRVGLTTSPPTLDFVFSTTVVTRQIGIHVFEGLVTFDERYQVIPQLAESWKASDDDKTYTFQLRKGVKFHNGQEMKAADVKASIERFLAVSPRAKDLKTVREVSAAGDYTVQIRLAEPTGAFLPVLGMPIPSVAIMPADAVREASGKYIPGGKLDTKQLIGTGPYRIAEWVPDRHVRLVRFPEYARDRSRPTTGLGGDRVAYLDEIRFIPVPEKAARVAGLETGEYDFIDGVPFTSYAHLKESPGIVLQVLRPETWVMFGFNHSRPPFNDARARQAVLAALNQEQVMAAVVGLKEFYRLDPGLFFKEQFWHSGEAAELYDQKNGEKARKLLAEAGYKGQEIVVLTNSDYDWMLKAATVTQAQLKAIGMNAKLQVYDWPGSLAVRKDMTKWDLAYTGISLRFDPTGLDFMLHSSATWMGLKSPQIDKALEQGAREADPKKRYEAYRQLQRLVYTEVPFVKHGDIFGLQAHRAPVKGYQAWYSTRFWNVWLEK
ncbi:MAG: ABC transporter substrate-binding protein [Candidatus Rokubacteria bacterium]|nr:ABC transporter substrate-binding protein [Candidatus Rokubacteria bacterium]